MPEKQKECPACALEVDASAEECPYCGYEFPPPSRTSRWAAILFALLLAWPLFQLLKYLFG